MKHSVEKHDEELIVPKPERPEMDASGRFKCTRCEKTFELRHSCVAHIRKHKLKDSGRYQCKKCLMVNFVSLRFFFCNIMYFLLFVSSVS